MNIFSNYIIINSVKKNPNWYQLLREHELISRRFPHIDERNKGLANSVEVQSALKMMKTEIAGAPIEKFMPRM